MLLGPYIIKKIFDGQKKKKIIRIPSKEVFVLLILLTHYKDIGIFKLTNDVPFYIYIYIYIYISMMHFINLSISIRRCAHY